MNCMHQMPHNDTNGKNVVAECHRFFHFVLFSLHFNKQSSSRTREQRIETNKLERAACCCFIFSPLLFIFTEISRSCRHSSLQMWNNNNKSAVIPEGALLFQKYCVTRRFCFLKIPLQFRLKIHNSMWCHWPPRKCSNSSNKHIQIPWHPKTWPSNSFNQLIREIIFFNNNVSISSTGIMAGPKRKCCKSCYHSSHVASSNPWNTIHSRAHIMRTPKSRQIDEQNEIEISKSNW